MGPDAMILVFWMLSFKPTFSPSSFTFKRLFGSSLLSAKRVVSSAYVRLCFVFFLIDDILIFFLILKSFILTCVPKHEPPSHLPPHNISLGHPHAPAPSMLYPASDIDWRLLHSWWSSPWFFPWVSFSLLLLCIHTLVVMFDMSGIRYVSWFDLWILIHKTLKEKIKYQVVI